MFWIFLLIVAATLLLAIMVYNGLVQRRNRVRNAWAQIDVQLLRRSDLIPDLVESVRGYMRHEAAIFENITVARRQATAAGADVSARIAAEAALSKQVRGLLALAELAPGTAGQRQHEKLARGVGDNGKSHRLRPAILQ